VALGDNIRLLERTLAAELRKCGDARGCNDGFQGGVGAQAVILKSETYNFHRLDLTRQAGFIVTIYDEDGRRLAAVLPFITPAEAFAEARKVVDNKVEGPGK
jgi:hypothetical protein